MTRAQRYGFVWLVALPGLLLCGMQLGQNVTARSRAEGRPAYSEWSAPENLGAPVNTAFAEQGPSLSRDGLSLYFQCTGCPENVGGTDIWVSERASVNDSWGPPQRLGPDVNTAGFEGAPYVSVDGHRLFFNSDRPGGFGGLDLYVSRRQDVRDNFAWGTPVNLGPAINTAADEVQPDLFEDDATGVTTLYYAVGSGGTGGDDIYASTILPDDTYTPGMPVIELNSPYADRQPAIRRDGLEIFLASNRPGSLGGLDLWVATRTSTSEPWSTPLNLGPVVNSSSLDARPALSFDGTQLYFQSLRSGNMDLYRMMRNKLKGAGAVK